MNHPTPSSYARLLRTPGAGYAFGAATLTRLSYATLSLALLLAVQGATGSFAAAGTVLGAYGVSVLASPLVARLIDRYGRPRVLIPLGLGYGSTLLGIAGCAVAGLTFLPTYVGLAVLAGLTAPPVGPVMRQIWAGVTTTPADRQRAYSLDTVSEEVVFAVGPLAVGGLVGLAGPAAAVAATAVLALVGAVALAVVRLPRAPAATDTGAGRRAGEAGWRGPFTSPGFCWVVLVMVAVGLGLTPLEVAVAARATEAGTPAAAGLLLAALSVGSAVGGLIWGRMHHRRSPTLQLVLLLAVLAAGSVCAAVVQPLSATAVTLALTGLAVSPVFVVTYLMADDLVSPNLRVEASTWLTSLHNLGGAAGAFAAGVVVERYSAQATFLTGGALLGVTAVVVLVGQRQRWRTSPAA